MGYIIADGARVIATQKMPRVRRVTGFQQIVKKWVQHATITSTRP